MKHKQVISAILIALLSVFALIKTAEASTFNQAWSLYGQERNYSCLIRDNKPLQCKPKFVKQFTGFQALSQCLNAKREAQLWTTNHRPGKTINLWCQNKWGNRR